MKVRITSRAPLPNTPGLPSEPQGTGSFVVDVPDNTEEFLRLIEPWGRFSVQLPDPSPRSARKKPRFFRDPNHWETLTFYGPGPEDLVTLHFENDYD